MMKTASILNSILSERRKWYRAVSIIVIVAGLNWWLQAKKWYERYEIVDLDQLFKSLGAETGNASSDISIVQIGDDDYEDYFNGCSPLDPTLVIQIVTDIIEGHPRVLVVDLDTTGWSDNERRTTWNPRTPIIWSVVPNERDILPDAPGELFGIPMFQPGSDGRIRTYQRWISATTSKGKSDVRSLATAAIAAIDPADRRPPSTKEELIGFGLGYSQFRKVPASVFLRPDYQVLLDKVYHSAISGKIVFLGGTYRAARDSYPTPLGSKAGVEILAQAAQTEYTNPVSRLREEFAFLFEIVIGVLILWLVHWLGPAKQWFFSALMSLLCTALVSQFAYRTLSVFLPVFSVFAGVVLAGFVEWSVEYHRLQEEAKKHHVKRGRSQRNSAGLSHSAAAK